MKFPTRTNQTERRLLGNGGGPGVELLSSVVDDPLDQTLLLKVLDGSSGDRAVDCSNAK